MDPLELLLHSSPLFHGNGMEQDHIVDILLMVFGHEYGFKKFLREFWVYYWSDHCSEVTHKVGWQATTKNV